MNDRKKEQTRDEAKLLIELTDLWHERGINLSSRTIYLGAEDVGEHGESGIDARLAERVIKNIHTLELTGTDPITLMLNNVGGEVYHGLAIVDAIQTSPCRFKGVVRGQAMSMGSWLFQVCHERVMGPNAVQMIHYGIGGVIAHPHEVARWVAEETRLNRVFEGLYLGRIQEKLPEYTLAKLRKLIERDTFLTAQECVEMGLADGIG